MQFLVCDDFVRLCEVVIGEWKAPVLTAIAMQFAIWVRERGTRKTLLRNKKTDCDSINWRIKVAA